MSALGKFLQSHNAALVSLLFKHFKALLLLFFGFTLDHDGEHLLVVEFFFLLRIVRQVLADQRFDLFVSEARREGVKFLIVL